MSTPDPERAVERGADELEKRIEQLDDSIDDAKKKQSEQRAKDPGPLDGDDQDDAGSDDDESGSGGGDHGGFDDPEEEEEEEDK